jgi:FAD/FMN-containing dehydrogenase
MAIQNTGMRLEFDPATGKATISGLTAKNLGGLTPEDLQPIVSSLTALSERVETIERTAITRTSYDLEILPSP